MFIHDYCTSLSKLQGHQSIASPHELLEVIPTHQVEPGNWVALLPVIDGADANLPCHDAVNFVVAIEAWQRRQEFIDYVTLGLRIENDDTTLFSVNVLCYRLNLKEDCPGLVHVLAKNNDLLSLNTHCIDERDSFWSLDDRDVLSLYELLRPSHWGKDGSDLVAIEGSLVIIT